jgi:hypothetical protein
VERRSTPLFLYPMKRRDDFDFNRAIALAIVAGVVAMVAVHFWLYR